LGCASLMIFTDTLKVDLVKQPWGGHIFYLKNCAVTYLAYTWLYLADIGIIWSIIRYYRQITDLDSKRQIVLVALGLLMVTTVDLWDLPATLLDLNVPDLTTLAAMLGSCFLTYAILRYRLFIVPPELVAQNILATMPDLYVLAGPDGTIQSINRVTEELSGYTSTELTGQPVTSLLDVDCRGLTAGTMERMTDQDHLLTTRSDEKRIVALSCTVVRDKKNVARGVIFIGRDIAARKSIESQLRTYQSRLEMMVQERTGQLQEANQKLQDEIAERVRAERELQHSQAWFQTLFEMAPDGYFLLDALGNIVSINHAAAALVKLQPEDLRGRNIAALGMLQMEKLPEILGQIAQAMVRGWGQSFEFTLNLRDGTRRIAEGNGSPVTLQGKKYLLVVTRDITVRKELEGRLQEFSQRLLTVQEEEKKKLAADLHDELGSLAVGLSSALLDAEEEVRQGDRDRALTGLAWLKSLLNDSITRIKGMALALRPLDLDVLGLTDALREYLDSVEKNSELAIDFQASLAAPGPDKEQAIHLYRIVQEAINNIIKHAGADQTRIVLTGDAGGLALEITDDGCGLNMEQTRLDPLMAGKMGLRGMRERVASMQGTFTMRSIPQQGTTITVRMPYKIKS
jgi:PAS domain S-box-containing protein